MNNLQREKDISFNAGKIVGLIYDAFLKQYEPKPSEADLHSLNVLCVRLVFCLYAEDSGVFEKNQFYNYMSQYKPEQMRRALIDLFNVLNTSYETRDRFLDDSLKSFPYVNGALFDIKQNESIPQFDKNIADVLLKRASLGFDWSGISPTIFGAVFESTLNPETRREGGMHYTSIENIHKVIDPLFLDDLKAEFEKIKNPFNEKGGKKREDTIRGETQAFRNKLANLTFLDPAAGCGNFLTETYLSLRRLENELISLESNKSMFFAGKDFNPIRVSIQQFYGIEINDFAVAVAKAALWIAENQMMKETEKIIKLNLEYLPLKSYSNIIEGNALRIDWNELLPKTEEQNGTKTYFDYIMGNPPFVGARKKSKHCKEDIDFTFGKTWKGIGDLDYVCCWYKKASDYIQNTTTRCAFVSTNSIIRGCSVSALWEPLFKQGIHFDFARWTFKWSNENTDKKNIAAVHCVIIGFSVAQNDKTKIIYINETERVEAKNINGYLLDAPSLFIENRKKPLCKVSEIVFGSMPNDGGHLIIKADEYEDFIKNDVNSVKYIRSLLGADEFIGNQKRWCLWLVNTTPAELRKMPLVFQRIEAVKKHRDKSTRAATRKLAAKPWLFGEIRQPEKGQYLLIPSTSSENRMYIPIGFIDSSVISSNANLLIPQASLYEFGVLTSSIHMGWTRVVCGRRKSDYRYSNSVVYNNFPWPIPTEAQKSKIEKTAQAILDARALYPDSSLADLYDELTMPIELRKAHEANDRAVMEAYGFDLKMTEPEIVAELFKMYQKLVEEEKKQIVEKKQKKGRRKE